VDTYWRGAQLLSASPTTFDAALQPTARTDWQGHRRESLDPDDFSSGFAVWSGTSFAAPAFLGECLQLCLAAGGGQTTRLAEIVKDVAAKHRR
jgi:serine protease